MTPSRTLHLQVLSLSYPADHLVLAVKKGTPETDIVSNAASRHEGRTWVTLPSIGREQIYLAVHRTTIACTTARIEQETIQLLMVLRDGASAAEAATRAFGASKLTPAGQTETIQALALPDSKDDARAKVARQQVCFALYRVFVQQDVVCGLWAGKDEGPFKGAMHHGERTSVDRTRRREARLKDLCGGE